MDTALGQPATQSSGKMELGNAQGHQVKVVRVGRHRQEPDAQKRVTSTSSMSHRNNPDPQVCWHYFYDMVASHLPFPHRCYLSAFITLFPTEPVSSLDHVLLSDSPGIQLPPAS